MRASALPLLGLLLAVGCDQSGPVAPTDTDPAFGMHEITRIDSRTGTFEFRGLTGCFGELVIATGTVRYKEHTMTDVVTGNEDHRSFTFFVNGTAVGQTTGRVWKFKEILKGRLNTPNLAAPHVTETLTASTHLVGPGGSVKLKLALHVVLPGNGGELKVVVNTAKGPCRVAE
jgi:hypothetical protein